MSVRITTTALPGVGVCQELATAGGRRVGVVTRRTGEQDLVLYDDRDPDAVGASVRLTAEEAVSLAEVLGAPRVVEQLAHLQRDVSGLTTEQLLLPEGSPYAGAPLGQTRARTLTGVSIVAVVRAGRAEPAPGPGFGLEAGDVLLVVGTPEGVEQLRSRLGSAG